MRWRRFPRPQSTGTVVGIGTGAATRRPPVPDCWVAATASTRELRCLGRLDAERADVVDVWLWFTGTDGAVDLTPGERATLCAASEVRPLGPGDQERLARRLGHRQARAEHGRWGVWAVPIADVEGVLATALTRSARSGQRYPVVA